MKTGFTGKRLVILCLFFCLSWVFCLGLGASQRPVNPSQFKVLAEPAASIDDRLFGHFLERASWGEPGPEIALQPGTRQIYPEAIELMRDMNIPIIRFPGGTDIDYIDWRDLISNVPGRGPERPVTTGNLGDEITNNFGLDEYFQLRDAIGAGNKSPETILVANFLDAVSAKVPLEESALNAAGLIAYTNAAVGARLPAGMPDWPAVREMNGHPEPYGVEYLQIGNEPWIPKFREQVQAGTRLTEPSELAEWYLICLKAYIEAIDAVDPTVTLILDGVMGDGIERIVLADPTVRSRVKYATFHTYAPGPINRVKRDGVSIPSRQLTNTDWWKAWVAMPGRFSKAGVNIAVGNRLDFVRSLGYKVAVTEWNWNGWGFSHLESEPTQWRLASGIGTAGFLHGLMRQANDIELACQSLLIGANWHITSIRVDPDGDVPPYRLPQGQMTSFYSNHHGSRLLNVESANLPYYSQPFSVGWFNPPDHDIATIDLVATADEHRLYIHAINRSKDEDLPIDINLSAFPSVSKSAVQHLFIEQRHGLFPGKDSPSQEVTEITSRSFFLQGLSATVTLPKQSVSILEIPRSHS